MFSKIKDFLFGSAPVQSPAPAPYKVDAVPAGTEASIIASPPTAPAVEAVVVVPEAVVPEAVVPEAVVPEVVVETTPTKKAPAKKAPPAAKKPRAPKAK
jgi:hypothetical protein